MTYIPLLHVVVFHSYTLLYCGYAVIYHKYLNIVFVLCVSGQLARRALLRCYLDMGYGLEARELLDTKYPDDSSACFSWSRVMIEFVAHFLMKEEDCSVEAVEKAVEKGECGDLPFSMYLFK